MNARLFEELRPVGFAVAYRMLGSVSEAEDIVQEAFLRLHHTLQDGEQRRPRFEPSREQRERLARRFFAAAQDGDLGALEELLAPAAQRATALDVHKPYLARRFRDGCTNAAWLWDELRQQGYHGSRRSVRRYLNTLRAGTPEPNPLPPLPVRTFRRLVLRRPEWKAMSTGSKCSSGRCTGAPTSTCSGSASCSPDDSTSHVTECVPEPVSRGHSQSGRQAGTVLSA